MSTQEGTSSKKLWCRCVDGLVEHKYIARLNIYGTLIEVYECCRCYAMKRVELFAQQVDVSQAHGPGLDRPSRQSVAQEVKSAPLPFQA